MIDFITQHTVICLRYLFPPPHANGVMGDMGMAMSMSSFAVCFSICLSVIIPPHNKVVGGYIGFTPSVRPSSRVRSVAPTVLVGSISYLYILSSNFRRCVGYKVACKISKYEFLAIF